MSLKHFLALLGFAFVAAWIGFGFGSALLCLLGAGLFYGAASVVEGELDLGELQQRLRSPEPRSPTVVPPPPPARPRVR
jgi:hypothetical protein